MVGKFIVSYSQGHSTIVLTSSVIVHLENPYLGICFSGFTSVILYTFFYTSAVGQSENVILMYVYVRYFNAN